MFSSLEGEAQDDVSKLKEDAIKSKVGLKIILAQLGKKFQTLEILETYKGINYIFIIEYTNKFEKRLHRVKTYGIQMVFFFLSGISFTNIYKSQDCRRRGRAFL